MVSINVTGLLALITVTTAFVQFLPRNHEFIYKWRSVVKAGTYHPSPEPFQLEINAKLHLQTNGNSLVVKVTNLTLHPTVLNDKSDQAQDLCTIFKISYDNHGLAVYITTKTQESEFSRNIKRALASIFQIDSSVVSEELNNHHPRTVLLKENTIYGQVNAVYSIFPRDDALEVHKMNELEDIDPGIGRHKQRIVRNSKRLYVLRKQDGGFNVGHIWASGEVTNHHLQHRDDQFLQINQTFDLVRVGPSYKQHWHLKGNSSRYDLKYGPLVDTHQLIDFQGVVKNVRNKLHFISTYLQKSRLHLTPQPQVVNELRDLLTLFSFENFTQMHGGLENETLTIFNQMLPLVGTEASTLFVKHLIVHKLVSDSSAIHMLKHISDTIQPTLELLHKFEDVINVNTTWSVRKTAIISFGTLVHKSYITGRNDSTAYKKYVRKYVGEMTSNDNYQTKAAYIVGLRNMKLPLVLKHLVLGFNGELWTDEHLRLLCLYAAVPLIAKDTAMQTLWPVLTNRQELTELRIVAYSCLIKLPLSSSILKNLVDFMSDEPDQELCSFHYTYLKSFVKSKDPDLQELVVKLDEILALTPRPTRGISSANIYGYHDDDYDLTASVEEYFVKTNRSRLYGVSLSTLHEDYKIFIKVHNGVDQDPGLSMLLMYMLLIANNAFEDTHIEVVIVKQGQVLDYYYIDGGSSPEIDQIIELLNDETEELSKSIVDISYNRYKKTEFPSDLGLPFYWEFSKPDLHYLGFIKTKQLLANFIKYNTTGRYTRWMQTREGLSFLDPFNGTKHGTYKFHSYELFLNLHLDVVFDSKKHNVKVLYKKHDNGQTIWIRSFTTRAICVDDNYPNDSHHSKKQKALVDEDDFNFGHKLFIGVGERSSKSLTQFLARFLQTDTKHFNSPIQHMILTLLQLQDHVIVLPDPQSDSCTLTLEQSPKYDIESISLTGINTVHAEIADTFLPHMKWTQNWTLDFQNATNSLRVWTLNAILQVNVGHTLINISADLMRKNGEEVDVKVRLRGAKEWRMKEVVGDLSLDANSAVVRIGMTGRRSEEQKRGRGGYNSCQFTTLDILHCSVSHSTVRQYEFNIRTTNLPEEVEDLIVDIWEYLKSHYMLMYSRDGHRTALENNSLKIEVTYPMQSYEVDVHVLAPRLAYQLTGISREYWNCLGVFPDSLAYPKYFLNIDKHENFDYCVVHHDNYYTLNNKKESQVVGGEWQLYADNLYVKKTSELAVKVTDGNDTLEIYPRSSGHETIWNGRVSALEEHTHRNWVYWNSITNGNDSSVAVFLTKKPILLICSPENVTIVMVKQIKGSGQCYDRVEV